MAICLRNGYRRAMVKPLRHFLLDVYRCDRKPQFSLIYISWHVNLVKLCQAHVTKMTKPHFFLVSFFPPSFFPHTHSAVSSRGHPDIFKVCHFASAGTNCIGCCPSGTLQILFLPFLHLISTTYMCWLAN